MTNRLDRDFHLPGLLRFALPTIIMMLVVSLYTIVDGVLIARLVGENALAAANVAYPAISFTLAMGIMLGTGGSAVVAHKMGAGYLEEARRDFGFLALVAVCIGLAVCLAGALFAGPLARLLGASDLLLDDTVTYLRVQLCFAPMAMLQLLFESFFVTAGRPGLGLRRASPTPCWTISIWGLCRWAYWALPWALLRATRFPPWRGCSFSCSAGRGSALAAPTGICACWAGPASTARPRW